MVESSITRGIAVDPRVKNAKAVELLLGVKNHTEGGDGSLECGRAPFGTLLFFQIVEFRTIGRQLWCGRHRCGRAGVVHD